MVKSLYLKRNNNNLFKDELIFYVHGYAFYSNLSLFSQLIKIYGYGKSTISLVLNYFGLSKNFKLNDLFFFFENKVEINIMVADIIKLLIKLVSNPNNIKRFKYNNLKKNFQLKVYKGLRFFFGYPIRGQSTRNNAVVAKRLNNLSKIKYD